MTDPTDQRSSRSRLVTAVLAVVFIVGAAFVVFPLATSMPGKADSTATMMTAFRPAMTDQALAQGRSDLTSMQGMATELQSTTIPALAAQLKMTPAQLTAYLGQNFPAVAKGLTAMGTALPGFAATQSIMEAQQGNFEQADAIPMGGVSPSTVPYLFILPGILLMLVAIVGFLRSRLGRAMLAAATAVGVVMVIGLLSVSMSSKAGAADDMITAFKPVFATQAVTQARASADTFKAMGDELTTKAMPALAAALNVPPAQFQQALAATSPKVAAGLTALPAALTRMDASVSLVENQAANYREAASIPWDPGSMTFVFWAMMAPALGIVLVGGITLLLITGRRRSVLGAAPRGRPLFHG